MAHVYMFVTMYILIQQIFLQKYVLSQSSYCLWGRTGYNSALNGEYVYENVFGGNSYYKKTSGCYIFYIYWNYIEYKWFIHTTFDLINTHAYCTSSSLSNCNEWNIWTPSYFSVDPSVSLTPGSCPTLQCDKIQIPSLSNGCDVLFDVHLDDNIWTDTANTRYFYFNPWYFEWQCDETDPWTGSCSEDWKAYSDEGWTDITTGGSASIYFPFPYSNVYTVSCMTDGTTSPTSSPTPSPTALPTPSPTPFPTPVPTAVPTSIPTLSPTKNPTIKATTLKPITTTKATTTKATTTKATTTKSTTTATMVAETTEAPMGTTTASIIAPTSSPTYTATLNRTEPSFSPTFAASNLTVYPSSSPTTRPSYAVTDDFREGEVEEQTIALSTENVLYSDEEEHSSFWIMFFAVFVVVIISCILCKVFMGTYKFKTDQNRSISNMSQNLNNTGVKHNSVEIHQIPNGHVPHLLNIANVPQRDRVYTQSQYEENNDDDKEEAEGNDHNNNTGFGAHHEANVSSLEIDSNINDITPGSVGHLLPFTGESGDNIDYNGLMAERDRAVTEGANDRRIRNAKNERGRALMKEWLTHKIKLPQYYDVLVDNGYETLDIIKEVTKPDELREIGIVKKGHILKLMKEINRLENYVE